MSQELPTRPLKMNVDMEMKVRQVQGEHDYRNVVLRQEHQSLTLLVNSIP